jgi:hypothetical protein
MLELIPSAIKSCLCSIWQQESHRPEKTMTNSYITTVKALIISFRKQNGLSTQNYGLLWGHLGSFFATSCCSLRIRMDPAPVPTGEGEPQFNLNIRIRKFHVSCSLLRARSPLQRSKKNCRDFLFQKVFFPNILFNCLCPNPGYEFSSN